ncbi:MAG TPA: EAL domain-containing protein, partial [Pilimelia sp.]|nr:EAL domain-containing protein [Pilimelia sp.]
MEPAELRNSVPPERAVPLHLYVGAVVVAGAAVGAAPLAGLPARLDDLPAAFWAMAALAVLVDARPFTPPGRWQSAAVCPSVCFTFAILLAWGLGPAVAVQAAAVVVTSLRLRHALWRAAFNIAQYALALAAARAVTRLAGPVPFTPVDGAFPVPRWTDVAVAVLAGLAWFVVTHLAVATALQLRFGGGAWRATSWAAELLSTGALLALSPILLAAAHTTPALIPLVLVPIYAVYRMARLSTEQDRAAAVDALTGLASRKALVAEATTQVDRHADRVAREAPDPHLALVLIDLDRFKHVNDALGHAVGDRLLVEVGHRLRRAVRPADLVARLGGDEFAILAPNLPDRAAARELADGIAAALTAPVNLDGLPVDVAGSIGVAVFPEHGADFATLLRHADVAMYDAKHAGGPVRVYSPESDRNSAQRLGLLADLRRALTPPLAEDPSAASADGPGELGMFYQPQVEVATGAVVGVEALLRWRHPRRGLVDPEELIRVAEQSAVMSVLTRRVIDEVVAQVAAWQAGGTPLRASLNVSVRDLHSGEIADQIVDRLARHGVPPQLLQLEITEGALMADPRRVLATISRLDRIGVAIALDDFGTGYSSLQHLRRLPLTEVKVDRSFVLGMARDPDDAAIVRSIIELARALGLRAVAEGVEDEATWRLLHAAGCHVAQGWFHARPMPPAQLVDWLARYRPPRLVAH